MHRQINFALIEKDLFYHCKIDINTFEVFYFKYFPLRNFMGRKTNQCGTCLKMDIKMVSTLYKAKKSPVCGTSSA